MFAGSEADETATEHLAVLGSPIAHSKSPAIHAAAYRELGLAWSYGREELRADGLAHFLQSHRDGWRGFSLTMPLKEEAHRLASIHDPVARESGVVNTLLRLDSESQPWAGFNTDVGGLAAAIRNAELDASHTIVLGSGATAVSAILAARALGARQVMVAARNEATIGELVDRFDGTRETGGSDPVRVSGTLLSGLERVLGATTPMTEGAANAPTLVVSTLPGPAGAGLRLPEAFLGIPLFDVAYDPWPSPLAERWRAAGTEAHSGVDMLVEQALLQVRIFAGGDPGFVLDREDAVRRAMRAAA